MSDELIIIDQDENFVCKVPDENTDRGLANIRALDSYSKVSFFARLILRKVQPIFKLKKVTKEMYNSYPNHYIMPVLQNIAFKGTHIIKDKIKWR